LAQQVEVLKNSKQLLQRTLTEQLQNIRNQFDSLKLEKRKCEDIVEVVQLENNRLKQLVEREQSRNMELVNNFKKK